MRYSPRVVLFLPVLYCAIDTIFASNECRGKIVRCRRELRRLAIVIPETKEYIDIPNQSVTDFNNKFRKLIPLFNELLCKYSVGESNAFCIGNGVNKCKTIPHHKLKFSDNSENQIIASRTFIHAPTKKKNEG
jgi:hypothetical protein